ncbi:fibronectin type III domain-containing protein, partial [Mariniflexile sp. HMF6888]|uniref:fibronectin type III domain-containing protein n=1 Tax=Mariniflexile sp. HMF6888 TaxID=3373086 RepID=UPI0037876DB2
MKKIFLFHFLLLTTISIHSQNFQGWNKKQPIVINSSLVEGVSPLVDFPVLITLDHINDEVIDGGSYSALDGGGDIRFSSDATGDNQLATEIVAFVTSSTPANRKCQIWVKIPSLSPTTDTTIYLWYNKEGETQPLATDPYGSQAVWTNYEAVWHMENDPNTATPQILDATGNGYNLSSFGAMPASAVVNGAIGNGVVFDGVDDYFALANDLSLSSSYTFSAWYNWDSTSTQEHSIILSIGPTTYHSFSLYENLSLDYYGGAGATTNIFTSANTIAQDVMQKWDFVATNGAGQHYLNSNTLTANRTTGVVAGDIKYMGGDLENYMKGWLDEIRISSDSKSEDWIKTEYTNQTNASGFATAGIPQVALTDTQAPTAPTLSSAAQTDTTVDLSWAAATDNIAVTGYNVYRDGVLETTLGNVLSYQATGLTASTAYNFTVTALDAAGNESAVSNAVAITTD